MLRAPFHLLRNPCLALTPDSMQLSRADHQGSTPLHWAAWEGSEIVVKYACDTNHHFLAIAAVFPSHEGEMDRYLARLFLTKHQPRADLNRRNKFGYTALLYASCVHRSCLACTRPHIRIPLALRRSLAYSLALPEYPTAGLLRHLSRRYGSGHSTVASTLLSVGADPAIRSEDGTIDTESRPRA